MVIYDLPDRTIKIKNIVLDFNGTLACDGSLLPGVEERLKSLAERCNVYVLTSDTYNTAAITCKGLPVTLITVDKNAGGLDKERIIDRLGPEDTAAIGNGVNDALMLKRAALGLLVLGPEGSAVSALKGADVIFPDILSALDFLLHPKRVVATMRP